MRALVFSIDDAYLVPFKVLWHSLMKTESVPLSAPVFILHDSTLSTNSIKEVSEFLFIYSRSAIFLDLTSHIPDDLPITDKDHVSKATFYRLYVESILPEYVTSILYLDSDAIVVKSIRDLFELILTHPIGAVDHLSPENSLRLWGETSGSYFQAGLLLIDLSEWRRLNSQQKFKDILSFNRDRIQWWDQDVLNLAFEDKWQRLPIWYNVCAQVKKNVHDNLLREKGCFIHFDGSSKPWKYYMKTREAQLWYKFYYDTFHVEFDKKFFKRHFLSTLYSFFKKFAKS